MVARLAMKNSLGGQSGEVDGKLVKIDNFSLPVGVKFTRDEVTTFWGGEIWLASEKLAVVDEGGVP